jgi:hypothetical protein
MQQQTLGHLFLADPFQRGTKPFKNLPEYSSVQYTRIQDAISAIKMCQSDVYLAKCDIEMAYRNLPLSPTEYYKFGFNWDNQFYYSILH